MQCCYGRDTGAYLLLTKQDQNRLTPEILSRWKTRDARRNNLIAHLAPYEICPQWSPGTGCTIYHDRPNQCRALPQEFATDDELWELEAHWCPGIGKGKRLKVLQ